jgi:Leucine-rich repeat (LRR) protein
MASASAPKQVAATVPDLLFIGAHQAQPGLMHQRRRLQGLSGLLPCHLLRRQFAKFFIDQRQQQFSRSGITRIEGTEQLGHVRHGAIVNRWGWNLGKPEEGRALSFFSFFSRRHSVNEHSMNRSILTLIRNTFLLLTLFSVTQNIGASEAPPIFKDKNLEAAVRKFVFEKRDNQEPLTEADLANISTIQGKGMEITDLTGLEKCRNLASLDLAGNLIRDLSPLQGLARLQYLNLADNRIRNISPLSETPALQYIDLTHNRVNNLRPLSNLTNLASVYLVHNRVRDIQPLVNLPRLTSLYLDNNLLRDIDGIGNVRTLSTLSLNNNMISDISPIEGLNRLYYLFLENNEIRDFSPLLEMAREDQEGRKEFIRFLNLYLAGNPLGQTARAQIAELKEFGAKVNP